MQAEPREPTPRLRIAAAAKRLLDLSIALPLCILFAPVFAAIAMAVRLDSPGPALFRQRRRGRHLREFDFIKFRSLEEGAPDPQANYEMVANDDRITRVGAVLRRTSLDELPQLLHVVSGTMSLVGPRPLVEWESQLATRTHPERFEVKPGITGLSQVTVRNSVDPRFRLDQDVEYVRTWSFALDLRILLRTPVALLRSEKVYPQER